MNIDSLPSSPSLLSEFLLEAWQQLPRIYQGEVIRNLLGLYFEYGSTDLRLDLSTWLALGPNTLDWDESEERVLKVILEAYPTQSKEQLVCGLLDAFPLETRFKLLRAYGFKLKLLLEEPASPPSAP